jgi:hypothetical protein
MIGAGIFTTAIVVTGLIFLGAPTAEGKQRSDGKIPEVTDEKSAETRLIGAGSGTTPKTMNGKTAHG